MIIPGDATEASQKMRQNFLILTIFESVALNWLETEQ